MIGAEEGDLGTLAYQIYQLLGVAIFDPLNSRLNLVGISPS